MGYTYINLAFPSPLGFASTCRLPMISCRRCIPAADLFSNGTGFFNASTRLKSSSNPQTMVYLIILILRKPWNMVLNPDSMDACWRTVKRPPIQQSSSRFAQEPAMNPWFSHVFPMHFPCFHGKQPIQPPSTYAVCRFHAVQRQHLALGEDLGRGRVASGCCTAAWRSFMMGLPSGNLT